MSSKESIFTQPPVEEPEARARRLLVDITKRDCSAGVGYRRGLQVRNLLRNIKGLSDSRHVDPVSRLKIRIVVDHMACFAEGSREECVRLEVEHKRLCDLHSSLSQIDHDMDPFNDLWTMRPKCKASPKTSAAGPSGGGSSGAAHDGSGAELSNAETQQ
jgi:hypothetical protein